MKNASFKYFLRAKKKWTLSYGAIIKSTRAFWEMAQNLGGTLFGILNNTLRNLSAYAIHNPLMEMDRLSLLCNNLTLQSMINFFMTHSIFLWQLLDIGIY